VLVEGGRDARGVVDERQCQTTLFLGFLNSPLDVTDGGTIMNDALSYDVFADVGRAARRSTGGALTRQPGGSERSASAARDNRST